MLLVIPGLVQALLDPQKAKGKNDGGLGLGPSFVFLREEGEGLAN